MRMNLNSQPKRINIISRNSQGDTNNLLKKLNQQIIGLKEQNATLKRKNDELTETIATMIKEKEQKALQTFKITSMTMSTDYETDEDE